MGELFDARIVRITKAHFARQLPDGRFVARQKMPAGRGVMPAIAPDISFFLGGGQRGSFARVNADIDHLELVADLPFDVLQAPDHAVQHKRAKHRAAIITQHEDGRLFAKIIAQPDELAAFIAKLQIKGNLRAELLIKTDFLQRLLRNRLRARVKTE